MNWKEIELGHRFVDKAKVTQIHETATKNCFSIIIDNKKIILSEGHILLCDMRRVNKKLLKAFLTNAPMKVPLEKDLHIVSGNGHKLKYDKITKWEPRVFNENKNFMWMAVKEIYYLFSLGENIKLVTNDSSLHSTRIEDMRWEKNKPCFCVSTNTGRYNVCGLVHHNSVTLRNIINHCLTHSDDAKIGLVDLKLSEFSRYKDMDKNRVVGVANSVAATAQLLRMAREIMRKRNQQNSDRDLTDFADFQPQEPTDIIRIFGREFNENDKFDVEVDGQQKSMTAAEILEWMEQNRGKKV